MGFLNIESSNETPFVVTTPLPVVKQDPQFADIEDPTVTSEGSFVASFLAKY